MNSVSLRSRPSGRERRWAGGITGAGATTFAAGGGMAGAVFRDRMAKKENASAAHTMATATALQASRLSIPATPSWWRTRTICAEGEGSCGVLAGTAMAPEVMGGWPPIDLTSQTNVTGNVSKKQAANL